MGGGGATYDYGFRIYNPNIARFLSVDPLMGSYPWYTPYQFAGNKPIQCIDRDGLEEVEVHSASITGEIEALKLKGAGEDEIRGFVYDKMNIMNYSAIKGAELASKHMGYGNDGKIVEITNGYSKLIVWGYKPIYSTNEEGNEYISAYERYKVYEAKNVNSQQQIQPDPPKKNTPTKLHLLGIASEDLGNNTQTVGQLVMLWGAGTMATSLLYDDPISIVAGETVGGLTLAAGALIDFEGAVLEIAGKVAQQNYTGSGVSITAEISGMAAEGIVAHYAKKIPGGNALSTGVGEPVENTVNAVGNTLIPSSPPEKK